MNTLQRMNVRLKTMIRNDWFHWFLSRLKTIVGNYWHLYLLTTAAAFIIKNFSRTTDSDVLIRILAPTAWWGSVLGGISFEYLPHVGYVNHFHQFIIAPSCSGIRFLLILFLMLIFSFLHQIPSRKKGCLWFGFSALFSYIFTVFVNGIRIVVSIYLPDVLEKSGLMDGWLTSDRLHTVIGVTVYFTALCLAYLSANVICRHFFLRSAKNCASSAETDTFSAATDVSALSAVSARLWRLLTPVFWYLLAVLAFPLVKRIYRNEWEGFVQYAVLIICVCFIVAALFCAVGGIRAYLAKNAVLNDMSTNQGISQFSNGTVD